PWHMVVMSGAYIDDLNTSVGHVVESLALIGGAILGAMLVIAWLVTRDIAGSLGRLKEAMVRLAGGELSTSVPGTERRDEVGGMAGAVLVFKQYMERARELAAETEQQHEQAEATKTKALLEMAEKIESEATQALTDISGHTAAMAETANDMSASAAR